MGGISIDKFLAIFPTAALTMTTNTSITTTTTTTAITNTITDTNTNTNTNPFHYHYHHASDEILRRRARHHHQVFAPAVNNLQTNFNGMLSPLNSTTAVWAAAAAATAAARTTTTTITATAATAAAAANQYKVNNSPVNEDYISNTGLNDFNDTLFLLSTNFLHNGSSLYSSAANTNFTDGFYNTNSSNRYSSNFTSNITELYWDGRYPSGYTLTHVIIASIVVTILMIIIVVGNMLVIIAIVTEKSLKNIQNWFIASLAVADFFLGLIIMPFSLANELMGYWVFGSWWCDIHSAMDVLLCTASIMNLCLISLDRYWSITKAVDYLKSRTPARAAFMIAAVWIMSALICIPPLLGWKVKLPEGPLPKCQLSEDIGYVLYSALGSFYIPSCIMVFVYIRIYFAAKARARRGIKKHPHKIHNEQQITSFTTSNKQGTIPIPSSSSSRLPMDQPYQIATIERTPVNNNDNTPMKIPTVTCDLASDISTSEATDIEQGHYLTASGNCGQLLNSSYPIEQQLLPPPPPSPPPPPDLKICKDTLQVTNLTTSADINTSMMSERFINPASNDNNSSKASLTALTTTITTTTTAEIITTTSAAGSEAVSLLPKAMTTTVVSGRSHMMGGDITPSPSGPPGRTNTLTVGIDTDMVSEFEPSSSDSGAISRCVTVKPLKFHLYHVIFRTKHGQQQQQQQQQQKQQQRQQEKQHSGQGEDVSKITTTTTLIAEPDLQKISQEEVVKVEIDPAVTRIQKPRDPEKEKRRIARKKEKRATLILGLIMGSFIACWLPFFFLYILMPACSTHCNIPDSAFAIAFWLGYMNSALNPAIYTIFNKDFRRAFRRILFK